MLNKRFIYDSKPEIKLNSVQISAKKAIEEKIEKGIYLFEQVNCALCGSSNAEILAEKDRYGLKCNTKICKDCGFVYSSPRMTENSYAEFYDAEYRRLYVGTKTPGIVFFKDQQFRGERIYKYLQSKGVIQNQKLKILEIGCGAGGILECFKSHGHEVLGMDLGEEYLTFGFEKYGLNLKKGGLKDVDSGYKADIIIYSHVLEHLLDLPSELSLIKQTLSKNGVVYIEVPGLKFIHSTYDMNFLKYLQNAHTFHFTKNSLVRLFSSNGFSNIDANEQIRSVFNVATESNNFPQNKNEFNEIISYLTRNEKFRHFNFLKFKKFKWFIKSTIIKLKSK